MGQGQAIEANEEPLWAHPDVENGAQFPENVETDLKNAILALSQTHETFLNRHPDHFKNEDDFVYEEYHIKAQNAVDFDSRLAAWVPSLIPKRVSEIDFWRNYFSHIGSLLDQAVAGKVIVPEIVEFSASTPNHVSLDQQTSEEEEEEEEVEVGGDNAGDSSSSNMQSNSQLVGTSPSASEEILNQNQEDQKEIDHIDLKLDEERRQRYDSLFTEYIEPEVDETHGQYGDPIRWGIIGCGDVCEWKSGPAFQNARGSKLVAVMSRSSGRAKRFAERHNVRKWYSDALALVKDPDVEAVYIASPPGSHLELARIVCAAEKPCFVEKPMARSYEECKQMVKMFFGNSLPLFVAYYRRAQPRFIRAREIVTHHLGEISSINVRYLSRKHLDQPKSEIGWRVECEESGGGLFMDMASHTIDILDFLFGPLNHLYGDAVLAGNFEEIDVETVVSMSFRTESNIIGSCLWNFASSVNEDVLDITGTEGRMTMAIFGKEPPTLHVPGAEGVVSRQVTAPFPKYVHQPLVQTVCDELRGIPGRECPSPGYSAKRTARVMDIILRKYYRDRTDDFWKRPFSWDNEKSSGSK